MMERMVLEIVLIAFPGWVFSIYEYAGEDASRTFGQVMERSSGYGFCILKNCFCQWLFVFGK